MHRPVLVVIAILAAPGTAAAEPFVMPPLALHDRAEVAIDYTGLDGHAGVAFFADYRRKVASRVAVTAEAGVQGASSGGEGGWSLANVTIGAIYVARVNAVRVAGTVPLASDDGDAAIPGLHHDTARVADGERFAARQGALLIAGARRLDRAKAFAQVELGALALFRAERPDELRLRLGLAGGVRVVERLALIAELTTVSGILSGGLDPIGSDEREDFRHALDLGLRIDLPDGVLGVRLAVPLDAALRSRDAYVVGVDCSVNLDTL